MASKAFNAQGTVLLRGDGTTPTEVFTSVGQITDFQGPGGSAAVIDATNLSSTAKEKVLGLMDPGQFTFTLQFDTTSLQHQGLVADQLSRVKRNFKVTLSDPGTTAVAFTAYVAMFQLSGAVDKLVEAKVTLDITGNLVYTWPT